MAHKALVPSLVKLGYGCSTYLVVWCLAWVDKQGSSPNMHALMYTLKEYEGHG